MHGRPQGWSAALIVGCLIVLAGCASPKSMNSGLDQVPASVAATLKSVQAKFAPDSHLAVFEVKAEIDGKTITLTGEVDSPAAKQAALEAIQATGFTVNYNIVVLPSAKLGDRVWGIANLSLVNIREKPGNSAEMGTQAFMGNILRVWKMQTNWFLVQTADRYLGWTEGGAFTACTESEAEAWQAGPLLIVTALESRILEQPAENASPVSDVVQCDLVKPVSVEGDWFKVALPDGRIGYLPRNAAADYAQWQKERKPTAENIERTAKSFMGRPYFWGCNSARGLDCSGFTKLVFYLNGIELNRNAAQQCLQGTEVALDEDYAKLKKGDLLFFGRADRVTGAEKITHVGIYLEDKRFIEASIMVHVSSLDPDVPSSNRRRIRSLLHARRVLPNP